nr:hypothetical protein [candidate division Zixibacteria bacterium]
MKNEFRMIAKTLYGLEEILAGEIKDLGGGRIRVMVRSVEFWGGPELLYRANLWSRTATRILVPLRSFRVEDDRQLYKAVGDLNWQEYLDPDATLAIDPVVSHSVFNNSQYVAQKTKDAIVDQIRNRSGRRPSVDLENPDIRINIHIHQNRATLSLDSSGEPLHRRGYRTVGGQAPLNESLAAGIIALTGWDGEIPFVDIMCGSGTFVIEAALIARRIAPGLLRSDFGFMRWKNFDKSLFLTIKEEARKRIRPGTEYPVFGSDQSRAVIKEAGANARRAGVEKDIEFKVCPLSDPVSAPSPGVLVINPPYGERMGVEDINGLYRMIGDTLKHRFDGYEAWIFTGNMEAAGNIGLRASKRIKLYNGPLECRLLKYQMYQGSRKTKHKEIP